MGRTCGDPAKPIDPAGTGSLAERWQSLREKPSLSAAISAISALRKSGRTGEFAYGLWCFLRRPSRLAAPLPCPEPWMLAMARRNVDGWYTAEEIGRLEGCAALAALLPKDATVRTPALLLRHGTLIAGEYGEGKRLFHAPRSGTLHVIDHYERDPAVRHIHCIHPLDGPFFAVTTGDAAKYLDIWEDCGDTIAFVRRERHRLAGFTAAATIRGASYFGSDFPGRPNYLFRREDCATFFFPKRYRTQYAADMLPFEDRYILIATSNLACLGLQRHFLIFDCQTEEFHEV
jgi:hypothetical protein